MTMPRSDEPYGEPLPWRTVVLCLMVPYLAIAGTILTCWGLGQVFVWAGSQL